MKQKRSSLDEELAELLRKYEADGMDPESIATSFRIYADLAEDRTSPSSDNRKVYHS